MQSEMNTSALDDVQHDEVPEEVSDYSDDDSSGEDDFLSFFDTTSTLKEELIEEVQEGLMWGDLYLTYSLVFSLNFQGNPVAKKDKKDEKKIAAAKALGKRIKDCGAFAEIGDMLQRRSVLGAGITSSSLEKLNDDVELEYIQGKSYKKIKSPEKTWLVRGYFFPAYLKDSFTEDEMGILLFASKLLTNVGQQDNVYKAVNKQHSLHTFLNYLEKMNDRYEFPGMKEALVDYVTRIDKDFAKSHFICGVLAAFQSDAQRSEALKKAGLIGPVSSPNKRLNRYYRKVKKGVKSGRMPSLSVLQGEASDDIVIFRSIQKNRASRAYASPSGYGLSMTNDEIKELDMYHVGKALAGNGRESPLEMCYYMQQRGRSLKSTIELARRFVQGYDEGSLAQEERLKKKSPDIVVKEDRARFVIYNVSTDDETDEKGIQFLEGEDLSTTIVSVQPGVWTTSSLARHKSPRSTIEFYMPAQLKAPGIKSLESDAKTTLGKMTHRQRKYVAWVYPYHVPEGEMATPLGSLATEGRLFVFKGLVPSGPYVLKQKDKSVQKTCANYLLTTKYYHAVGRHYLQDVILELPAVGKLKTSGLPDQKTYLDLKNGKAKMSSTKNLTGKKTDKDMDIFSGNTTGAIEINNVQYFTKDLRLRKALLMSGIAKQKGVEVQKEEVKYFSDIAFPEQPIDFSQADWENMDCLGFLVFCHNAGCLLSMSPDFQFGGCSVLQLLLNGDVDESFEDIVTEYARNLDSDLGILNAYLGMSELVLALSGSLEEGNNFALSPGAEPMDAIRGIKAWVGARCDALIDGDEAHGYLLKMNSYFEEWDDHYDDGSYSESE